ncbi:Uncharacterized protein HZ326_22160, partial [Fusarium oxysporum f. sp. albedinis]
MTEGKRPKKTSRLYQIPAQLQMHPNTRPRIQPCGVVFYVAAKFESFNFSPGNEEGIGAVLIARGRHHWIAVLGPWLSHDGRILLVPIPAKASQTAHASHSCHAHADATLSRGEHTRKR